MVTPPQPHRLSNKDYPYRMTEENFRMIEDDKTDYYQLFDETEIPQLMTNPTFMCLDGLKSIINVYDPSVRWKSLFLIPGTEEQLYEGTLHYWIPSIIKQDCIHEDCEIMPNGAIEKLILDEKKIRNRDIFQVADVQENYVVVSLALAESINRRHLYGVITERVEVR